jgi:hypothetical protein
VKRDGSITEAFGRLAKAVVTYSHRQHTYTETRCVAYLPLDPATPDDTSRIEIVRWVAESKRPFVIVKDRGFRSLMKTGRPEYRLPSPATVSRDVKHVFIGMRAQLAANLKVNLLSSPNPMLTLTHRHTTVP